MTTYSFDIDRLELKNNVTGKSIKFTNKQWRNCGICNKRFIKGLDSKYTAYCSEDCKTESKRLTSFKAKLKMRDQAGYKNHCGHCNKEFQTVVATKIYCSEDCKRDAGNDRRRKPVVEIQCKWCQVNFIPGKYKLYCSDTCKKTEHHRRCIKYKYLQPESRDWISPSRGTKITPSKTELDIKEFAEAKAHINTLNWQVRKEKKGLPI